MTRARADALLLLVALIWGSAFVAQKAGAEHLGPLTFMALRFSLAALVLLPLALLESKRQAQALNAQDYSAILQISACLCVAATLQQCAMSTTSAGNAGFLTAIYIVGVPFVAWAFSGHRPKPLVISAALIALGGAWLLGGGSPQGWSLGDTLILLSDVAWAFHITWIGHFRNVAHRPILLSLAQCLVTAASSLILSAFTEPWVLSSMQAASTSVLYAGLLSSVVAFTLQIIAQRHTPPAEAALIMSLESVFAAITGAWVLGEQMSLPAKIGAAMIFIAVLLIEIGPYVLGAIRARGNKPSP